MSNIKTKKTTKRSLTASIISMVACVALLIATTFAWFTSTASTSVNKIQAGELEVGLEYAKTHDTDGNPQTWESAEGKILSFMQTDGSGAYAQASNILWEPGCTYNLPALKVTNTGNLAFKYKLNLSGIDGEAKLLDVIDFTVNFKNKKISLDTWEGILLPEGKAATAETNEEVKESSSFVISAHMKENAGNEYQGLSVNGIGITVYATQYTSEFDSFENTYDLSSAFSFADYVNVEKVLVANQTNYVADDENSPTIKAEIPSGSTTATEVALIKKETTNPDSIQIDTGESLVSIDLKIVDVATNESITATGDSYFTIGIQIGNVDLKSFYHKGVPLTKVDSPSGFTAAGQYCYDTETGVVTLTTKDFSPFSAKIKYSGGTGTEKYPYLIANNNDWLGINNETQSVDKYYKQVADIVTTAKIEKFAGTYDGDNHKLTNNWKSNKSNVGELFCELSGHGSFKNINVTMTDHAVPLLWTIDWGTAYGADFENITFDGNGSTIEVNLNNFGFLVIDALYNSGTGAPVYNFVNITNNVSVENAGTAAGTFVGSGPCFNIKSELNYINCTNNGNITGKSYAGFLYGNPTYISTITETKSSLNISNCKNTGIIHAVDTTGLAEFALKLDDINAEYQEACGGSYISGSGALKDASMTINQSGTAFTVKGAPADYTYKLAFCVGSTYFTMDGEAWTDDDVKNLAEFKNGKIWYISSGLNYFCNLAVDENGTGGHTAVKALDKRTAQAQGIDVNSLAFANNYALVVKDGTTYLILDIGDKYYVNSSATLNVYAYNSSGALVGIKAVS